MQGVPKTPLPIARGSTARTPNTPGEMQHQLARALKIIDVRSFPALAFRAREVGLPALAYFPLFAVALTGNIHREAGLSFTCWWMCDPQKQISTDSLLYRVQPSGNHS